MRLQISTYSEGTPLHVGQTLVMPLGQLVPGEALTHPNPAVIPIQGGLQEPVTTARKVVGCCNNESSVRAFPKSGLTFHALLFLKTLHYYHNINALEFLSRLYPYFQRV